MVFKKSVTLFFFLSVLTVFSNTFAAEWKGSSELSYLETSGNTNSKTFLILNKVERIFERYKLLGEFLGVYGQKDDKTSDKNWLGKLKYERNITPIFYLFLMETIDRNKLAGINIRYATQLGGAYYAIKTDFDIFKFEAGLGYTKENPISPLDDNAFITFRTYGEYEHIFSEITRFMQTAQYVPNIEETQDYTLTSDTSLTTNLMGNMALKLSFIVNYDNLPPKTFKKSDRLFKTSFLYTF